MEQSLNDHRLYNCLICQRKAHDPVLTRCGHLFCWRCFYNHSKNKSTCYTCSMPVQINDVYPIFIDHDQNLLEEDQESIPQRPMAQNRPKIANPNLIANHQTYHQNNIALNQIFAGNVFAPPLGVNMLSQMGDPLQGQPQKAVSLRLKAVFAVSMAIVIIFMTVSMFF